MLAVKNVEPQMQMEQQKKIIYQKSVSNEIKIFHDERKMFANDNIV